MHTHVLRPGIDWGTQENLLFVGFLPGPTVTLPGPTVTLPGPTVTLPGPTVTLPGPTVERGSVKVRKAFLTLTPTTRSSTCVRGSSLVRSYGLSAIDHGPSGQYHDPTRVDSLIQ